MGGKVSLESVVGIGSHFTVRIPLKKAEDEFTGETPASPISRYLRNASVLVLDNDAVQCTMTRDMLGPIRDRVRHLPQCGRVAEHDAGTELRPVDYGFEDAGYERLRGAGTVALV